MHFGLASYGLLYGQFVVGFLFGMIWSPCVGPTLGVAIVLASQGKHLAGSAALMGLFSVGAALPIVILGYISRPAMMSIRGRLLQAGRAGKIALGSAMLLIAIATANECYDALLRQCFLLKLHAMIELNTCKGLGICWRLIAPGSTPVPLAK